MTEKRMKNLIFSGLTLIKQHKMDLHRGDCNGDLAAWRFRQLDAKDKDIRSTIGIFLGYFSSCKNLEGRMLLYELG